MATQAPAPVPAPTELKTVYIDGFEKGVTPELLYNCFKKYNVRTITMSKIAKSAHAEFPSEAVAKEALINHNGKPLLKRPLRMSLKCDKAVISQFSLTGLDKDGLNLNKIYIIAEKYGRSCKLGFNVTDKNKVVSRGYVSYTDFKLQKLEELKAELEKEGVVCSPYTKISKSYVRIDKFAEDSVKTDLTAKIAEFTKLFREQLHKLCNFAEGEYNINISANAKGDINEFTAAVVFDQVEKAARFYEELSSVAASVFPIKPSITIRVSEEPETLTNLVAFGIKKPADVPIDRFEAQVSESLKKTFKGILQVKAREIRKKEVDGKASAAEPGYLLHVTLQSEEDGKELMATYLEDETKKKIAEYFVAEPFFNMFCSSIFRKEFKRAKDKYKRMEKDIKNNLDSQRKQDMELRNYNNKRMPLMSQSMPGMTGPMSGPMPGPMSGMPGGPMPRMPMGPMGPMGGMYPMGPMGGMPMNPMVGGGMNPMGPNPMMGPADLNAKRKEFLRDKEIANRDPNIFKRVAVGYIIADLESLNVKDSRKMADIIVKREDPRVLFSLVENIQELKKKVQTISPEDLRETRQ